MIGSPEGQVESLLPNGSDIGESTTGRDYCVRQASESGSPGQSLDDVEVLKDRHVSEAAYRVEEPSRYKQGAIPKAQRPKWQGREESIKAQNDGIGIETQPEAARTCPVTDRVSCKRDGTRNQSRVGV